MSAAVLVQAGVLAHLRAAGIEGLMVFDAPPVRGSVPYAVVGEPVMSAADAAGVVGRLGTIVIGFVDAGERPVRLRGLVGAVEDAVGSLAPVDLGEGWRLVGMRLARSRIAVGKGDRWLGSSEFAVRVFRIDS